MDSLKLNNLILKIIVLCVCYAISVKGDRDSVTNNTRFVYLNKSDDSLNTGDELDNPSVENLKTENSEVTDIIVNASTVYNDGYNDSFSTTESLQRPSVKHVKNDKSDDSLNTGELANTSVENLKAENSKVTDIIVSTSPVYNDGYNDSFSTTESLQRTNVKYSKSDKSGLNVGNIQYIGKQRKPHPLSSNSYDNSVSDVTLSEGIQQSFKVSADAVQGARCKRQLYSVLEGMDNGEAWAFKMYESSSIFPNAVLEGAFYQLGNFDECLSSVSLERTVHPQYCIADVVLSLSDQQDNADPRGILELNNTAIHWAVCLPSTCTHTDVEDYLTSAMQYTWFASSNMNTTVTIKDSMCQSKKYIQADWPDIIFGLAMGFFVLVISVGTFYHIATYSKQRDNKRRWNDYEQLILSFSLISNMEKLACKGSSNLGLGCISGIKTIAMLFIIAGHSLIFLVTGPVLNSDFYDEARAKVQNAFLLNSPLLVDTFLLVGGFLMSRMLILELEKRNGKVNFLWIYIFRYIRLTPAYLVMVGLYSTWLVNLGSGPLWESTIQLERERCRNSWWLNILYINNYVSTDQLCMFQSWYLSADTQLFMIAPFLVYPLWRWRRVGEGLLGAVAVVTVVTPFIITLAQNLEPTLLIMSTASFDLTSHPYFNAIYIKTHMRASSYFIGILFGYLVHRVQATRYTLPRTLVYVGWCVSSVLLVTSMFSITVFYIHGHVSSALESATYCSLHRLAWSLGTGWVLLACVTGHGGVINKLLNLRLLAPLSRLTYCAYLVNGLVEIVALGTVRQARYMSIYSLLSEVLSHVCLTFLGALVLCLTFESPIHAIEKIILHKVMKPTGSSKTSTERLQQEQDNES